MSRVRPFITSVLAMTLMSSSPSLLAQNAPNPFASAKRMVGDNGAAYQGSDPYVRCQAYGNDTWDKLLNKQDRWDGAWYDVTEKGIKNIQESLTKVINAGTNVTQADLDTLKTKAESVFSTGHLLRMELFKCEAYLGLTKDFDGYADGEATVKTSTKSFDGQIKCETAGAETQDYTGCVSALTIYNGAAVAQTGMNTYQQIDYMGHEMDQTSKVQQNANSATIGLEVQRDSMEKQGQMATQLAALDGARAGAFMAALNNIPTREDIINSCKNAQLGNTIDQKFQNFVKYFEQDLIIAFTQNGNITFKEHEFGNTKEDAQKAEAVNSGFTHVSPTPAATPSGEENTTPVAASVEILKPQLVLRAQTIAQNCERVGSQANALTMNGKARDAMKQAALAAGIEMAANLGKAALFNKYAGKLDDAIGGVQSFEEELAAAPTFMDGTFTECQTNPNAAGCPFLGDDRVVDYYSGGISINGNSAATTGGELGGTLTNDNAASRDTSSGSKVTGPIASPGKIADVSNEMESIASKATVSSSGQGNPGGGSGSGPGSASAPSGGSAQPYNEDGDQKQSNGSPSKTASYTGVTAGVSMSGGGRAPASNNKDKPENPFANMFGKGAGGSDALNFRGVASNDIGAKGGSVFDMISRRYSNVQEQKRLLEYQLVK
jgi:hypothetical protein